MKNINYYINESLENSIKDILKNGIKKQYNEDLLKDDASVVISKYSKIKLGLEENKKENIEWVKEIFKNSCKQNNMIYSEKLWNDNKNMLILIAESYIEKYCEQ